MYTVQCIQPKKNVRVSQSGNPIHFEKSKNYRYKICATSNDSLLTLNVFWWTHFAYFSNFDFYSLKQRRRGAEIWKTSILCIRSLTSLDFSIHVTSIDAPNIFHIHVFISFLLTLSRILAVSFKKTPRSNCAILSFVLTWTFSFATCLF